MADGLCTNPNTFQRLMLQWERLAPYNAGQYATLSNGSLTDIDLAWRNAVLTLGLQQIGQSPDTPIVRVDQSIESYVSDELNRRFTAGDSPLRPFICIERDTAHVGVIYRHVVADSASIRLVMRVWIEHLIGQPRSIREHIELMRGNLLPLLNWRDPIALVRDLCAEVSRTSRIKKIRRLRRTASPTAPVAWRRVDLPDGTPSRLLRYARRHGVKVNDLFITAAALACDSWLAHEENDDRLDLAIGTIVDVRPADRPPQKHFGISLGFLQTYWRWQDLRSWPHALITAAAQSRLARKHRAADSSAMRLWAATRIGDRLNDAALGTFYRKRCPLAAGISNVNLNLDWHALQHPSPLRAYTRISPLGPMLPLVITPTTLGDTMHLGVTWRTSAVTQETCESIVVTFVERLLEIAD